MRKVTISSQIGVFAYGELCADDLALVASARHACNSSYAPYSGFSVGAAVRLANGVVLEGSNQENAAFPSGICAERNVLFHAAASHPGIAVCTIAIAARSSEGFTAHPCTPCGSCRQVMQECEKRQNGLPIRLILCGRDECYIVEEGMKALLPLAFQ